ncbi:MAG: hypothetical protein ACT4P6_06995 [Gemmatimonadaceae bacterium]
MTTPIPTQMPYSSAQPNRARSIAAVTVGFLAVVVFSLATDQVLHMTNVYPSWGQPMWEPSLNLLALGYRSLYTVLGGYITAKLAPRNPTRHVRILAGIGLVLGVAAAIGTVPMKLGPAWYPIALAVSGPLFTILGGRLHRSTNT